jgi:type IV secretion system protein VirB4
VDKMGFDMTHFLDNEPPNVLAALSMYLFHRLEQSLDGRLVSVFMDEGWQYLDNVYWKKKLRKWLPTLRKLNCHIVLATRSPKSVAMSDISHVILDNCATQMYFANPQARKEHYIDGFNLTEAEYQCIKNTSQVSRYFVFKQGSESNLCRFNLSHMKNKLKVFSATKESTLACDEIRRQYGNQPQHWLPHFLEEKA